MGFNYKIKVTGNKEPIWAEEIDFKLYKDTVKSLYSDDNESFILHTNKIIDKIVPNILEQGLNIIDKLIILLEARSVCIHPDLKLKIKCQETGKDFDYTAAIDKITRNFVDIDPYKSVTVGNITIECSLIKAKDEHYFLTFDKERKYLLMLASSIDKLNIDEQEILFKGFHINERLRIVESLPCQVINAVIQEINLTEKKIAENKLLTVYSPFTGKLAVELPLTLDIDANIHFLKLLFTEDLGNLHTLTYNLINKSGFSGEYLDNIAPVEVYIHWAYCQQQINSENNSASRNQSEIPNKSNPFMADFLADSPPPMI